MTMPVPTPFVGYTMSFASTDPARAHSGAKIDGGFQHRRGVGALKVRSAVFATRVK
jgi:hypothetical protein